MSLLSRVVSRVDCPSGLGLRYSPINASLATQSMIGLVAFRSGENLGDGLRSLGECSPGLNLQCSYVA